MSYLSLDIDTNNIGYVLMFDHDIKIGTIDVSSCGNLWERIYSAVDKFKMIFNDFNRSLHGDCFVVLEAPFVRNSKGSLALARMHGAIMMEVFNQFDNIVVSEIAASAWQTALFKFCGKKRVVGVSSKERSSINKLHIRECVDLVWPNLKPDTQHEYDALGLLWYVLKKGDKYDA